MDISSVVQTGPDGPWLLSIKAVCELTGLGRSRLYEELRSGRLASLKVGARRLVPPSALQTWISDRLAEEDST